MAWIAEQIQYPGLLTPGIAKWREARYPDDYIVEIAMPIYPESGLGIDVDSCELAGIYAVVKNGYVAEVKESLLAAILWLEREKLIREEADRLLETLGAKTEQDKAGE